MPGKGILPTGPWRVAAQAAASLLLLLLATAADAPSGPANSGRAAAPVEVLSVKNGEVTLRRDGKTYILDLAALSPEERAAARAWKPAAQARDGIATTDSDIEIKIAVEPAPTPADGSPAQLVAKVHLLNKETLLNFKNLKGTLILIGEETGAGNRRKVLAVQKFSGDLLATGKYDFTGPAVADPAAQPSAKQPGYHYQGYLFILQNRDNNIIQFRHSEPFVKNGEEALQLEVGAVFAESKPMGYATPKSKAGASRGGGLRPWTNILPLGKQP
jgi:hypothetical protein